MHQIEMVSLNDLIPESHTYRQFIRLWSFAGVSKHLKKLEKDNPYKGYGLLRLFKCLLLQFMEDLSDRELEHYLQENTAAKWFCEFGLTEPTPDFSVFNKIRTKLGTKLLSKIFSELRDQLKQQGVSYERVFAHQNKRVRYRGVAKNQFAAFLQAICFNLKRLVVLEPPGLSLC